MYRQGKGARHKRSPKAMQNRAGANFPKNKRVKIFSGVRKGFRDLKVPDGSQERQIKNRWG